jgi:hypothetical protein
MENNKINIRISKEALMELSRMTQEEAFNWLNQYYGIDTNRIHSVTTVDEKDIQPLLIVKINTGITDNIEKLVRLGIADDLENAGIDSEWIKQNIIK